MPKDLFIAQEMLYFGGNGRLAFEEVIMELGKRKCIPVLLCGLMLLLNYSGYQIA